MRILMLATYFPKPFNPIMGTWALSQAQALQRSGLRVEVVSLTSYVPSVPLLPAGALAYARCPVEHTWGDLRVRYPRWLAYPLGPDTGWRARHPERLLGIGWTSAAPSLRRIVREVQPDVLYAHHTAVNGYIAERIQRETGLPYVITDHDFDEIASCATIPARRRMFDRILGRAYRSVSVASRMENEIQRLFRGVSTITVQNGTDPIPDRVRGVPRPGHLQGRTVIFSCGAFYERKGFPLLIDAFAQIAGSFPNAMLRIAGDGRDREEIELRVRKHALQDRVELLGFQPHERILQEMVWCDVFALVGWDEPFATVYSEAMSAGKPVVCSRDGGITDVLQNEIHGLTVEPRDAISAAGALARLLGDENLRARLGAAAAELFRNRLTWDHNAHAMSSIFAAAVETCRSNDGSGPQLRGRTA